MMRTYHIFNTDGAKVAEQEVEDAFRPSLLAGHVAKLVAIDGEKLHRKSQAVLGSDQPQPDDEHLETEEEFRARRAAYRAEREPKAVPQPVEFTPDVAFQTPDASATPAPDNPA